MVSYVNLSDEDLTKEKLIQNEEFMQDVRTFLRKRNNKVYATRDSTFEAYLDHMRTALVGDVTPLFDYQYAYEADDKTRAQFAGIRNIFDRYNGDEDFFSKEGFDRVKDYVLPVLNPFESPSTFVGLGTLGTGAVALKAGIQGAKFGLKKLLAYSLKDALKPVAVEASVGTLVGAARGDTERLLGQGGNWKTGALTEGLARGAGALIGGGVLSAVTNRKAYKLGSTTLRAGREAQENAAKEAIEQTAQILKKNDPYAYIKGSTDAIADENSIVAVFANRLKSLDEEMAEHGIELGRKLGPEDEALVAGLSRETINSVVAAGVDIAKKVGWKGDDPADRITQRVANALAIGKLPDGTPFSNDMLDGLAARYNLTREDLANLWVAEFSEAGRTLRAARTIKEGGESVTIPLLEANVKQTLAFISDFSPATADSLTAQVEKLSRMGNAAERFFNDKIFGTALSANKLRLGFMTSKFATTIRNAANVGLRLPLHMIEYVGTGGSIVDALKIPFGLFNKAEAEALAFTFEEANPKVFKQIFRSAMDIEQRGGGAGRLATLGRKFNVLNTYLDNTVKKTVLLGEFRKIARSQNQDFFNDIIGKGQLKQFLIKNRKEVDEAINETLSLVYQKGYKKDSFAGKFIEIFGQSKWSLLGSILIPFPRYLANQTEFVYKHMPILGAIAPVGKYLLGRELPKGQLRKTLWQQASGVGMMYTAMQFKIAQGPEIPWNQFRDPETGQITDITALLGPFAPTFFATDLWYRLNEGNFDLFDRQIPLVVGADKDVKLQPPTKYKQTLREGIRAFTGLQSRVGTGAYFLDSLVDDVLSDVANLGSENDELSRPAWVKIRNKVAADWVNTFTIPFGVLTELEATFDPEGRKIMDNNRVDLNQYFWNYALRSLPNTEAMKNTEEFFGINIGLANTLAAARGTQVEQQFPGSSEKRRRFAPFVRELTGLTPIYGFRGKPLLEREISRLGIDRVDWTPRHKSPAIKRMMKALMGSYADGQITAVINSPEYQRVTAQEQRIMLGEAIRKFKIKVRQTAEATVSGRLGDEVDRFKFESQPTALKNYAAKKYEEGLGRSLVEDQAWRAGLNIISNIQKGLR